MRRYIKLRILNELKTIDKALSLLRKLIDADNSEKIQVLLPDIQDAIIHVGNMFEEQQGEGCEEVKVLEEACEIIWQINVLCGESNKQERMQGQRKAGKILPRKIYAFRDLVSQIQEETVVFFFPYKAAMWDSLYGAYLEMTAEENCTVRVIPIPYYEKNQDGSLGKMYYELELFPKDLPLLAYDQCDYEAVHPDIVFIHNPYDEYNIVTTVHPFFYSGHIKTFTDKLIYIPYFVHPNEVVKDHFCLVPGVVNADEVYLQSEKVKEQYIQCYKDNCPNLIDYHKFIVKTSSKLLDYTLAQEELPAEWRKMIYQGDKRRKVVFFNTHLSCVMKGHSDEFFIKIQEVFDTFKENTDVVLLWRPHPLTLSTIRSMNPEVENQYLELVEQYKAEHIGIYDDSADLHRAVNVSDAYYGSTSSVMEMFRVQQKPIMVMNLKIHQKT